MYYIYICYAYELIYGLRDDEYFPWILWWIFLCTFPGHNPQFLTYTLIANTSFMKLVILVHKLNLVPNFWEDLLLAGYLLLLLSDFSG